MTYNVFGWTLNLAQFNSLLILTSTSEPSLLCDDVRICDVGLLLSITVNTMLFSVDDKHLIKVPGKKNGILHVSFLKNFRT